MFLDVWPTWAVGSLLMAGVVVLICRMFVPQAARALPWLWLGPLVAFLPVAVLCAVRRYRPAEVAALADSLGGGQGMLLTDIDYGESAWSTSPLLASAVSFPMPHLRPWRKLAPLLPAGLFLAAALWVPQRTSMGAQSAVAEEIAADLTASVQELKQQALVTPEEEKRLEEEIERIRRAARDRVDASAWEAADALKEKMSANAAQKQDALKWAEESLARYNAASAAGASAEARAAHGAELAQALDNLAKSGLLAGAPADLQALLKGGKLPTDAASMRQLTSALAKYLAESGTRAADLVATGRGRRGRGGRFDPSEFPIGAGDDGDGLPGRGGVNRGRADADLTWGKESLPVDRFKSRPLPPGAAASPDDWAPLVEATGAPQVSPAISTAAAARQYAPAAGQSAWRRTLAPRHRTAVRKYFVK
jgi:hypothetical protein